MISDKINEITKIKMYNNKTKNEILISKKIRNIENYNYYFNPILKYKIIYLKEMNKKRSELKKMKFISVKTNEINENKNIINFFQELKEKLNLNYNEYRTNKLLLDYLLILKQSILLLQKENILLGNIKPEDIIIRDYPILYNFKNALDIKEINNEKIIKWFKTFNQTNRWDNIDILFWRKIFEINENIKIEESFIINLINKYEYKTNEDYTILKKYINKYTDDLKNNIWNLSEYKKWDIMTIINIITYIQTDIIKYN